MNPQPQEARCRGCNAKIAWAEIRGRRVPIDLTRCTVFEQDATGAWVDTGRLVYVNHFKTCPARDKFYGKREVSE